VTAVLFFAAAFPGAALAAKATAGKVAAAAAAGSLISPADEWGLMTTLIVCAAAGLRAEKTQFGAALSAPLVTMFFALVLVNTGVLPPDAPMYGAVNKFLVPLAVPMLLLGADLRRVFRDTGSLLLAFVIGSVATVVSTITAAAILPMHHVDGAWKIAAALCSRHIGGAINYVAVSDVLQAPAATITAGIAADNLVVAVFFITLFAIANKTPCDATPPASAAAPTSESNGLGKTRLAAASSPLKKETKVEMEEEGAGTFTINQLASALAVSASVCLVADKLVTAFALTGWTIPIATALIIFLATVFPSQLSGLRGAGEAAGVLFMQLFFAATGAAGSIRIVLETAPVLFFFSALHLSLHLAILLVLGKLFYRPASEGGRTYRQSVWWNKLLVASNANVGGPTTAAGMATAKKWRSLIVPALLVGVFGYAIATFLSVFLGRTVLQALMAPPL